MTDNWRIIIDDLSGTEIRQLLQQHFDSMLAYSPRGSCHFLDFEGLKSPDVTFWSIHMGPDLAGCGALRILDADHGEIKSMRTADAFLRRGVAARMLGHIIDEARARNLNRLSLETGSSVPFAPAIALYRRFGFDDCPPFGGYRADSFNRFLTRTL